VGEELCANAMRGGTEKPATIKSSKLNTVTAKKSIALVHGNRTTQSDASLFRAVGHLDLRCF
jgi:hypothetical protein